MHASASIPSSRSGEFREHSTTSGLPSVPRFDEGKPWQAVTTRSWATSFPERSQWPLNFDGSMRPTPMRQRMVMGQPPLFVFTRQADHHPHGPPWECGLRRSGWSGRPDMTRALTGPRTCHHLVTSVRPSQPTLPPCLRRLLNHRERAGWAATPARPALDGQRYRLRAPAHPTIDLRTPYRAPEPTKPRQAVTALRSAVPRRRNEANGKL